MTGHGAQKLFGWYEGPGLEGTSGWLESMGLRPGRNWALAAGLSEFGGGLLTLFGFLNPLGPLGVIGSMCMATMKVHWVRPVFVTSGGPELPLTNIAVATALMATGPGKYSFDRAYNLQVPRWIAFVGFVVMLVVLAAAWGSEPPQGAEEEAREDLAGGDA